MVWAVSSCRATSFYLAPSVMRYFKDHTVVAVLPDGTWIEITHRNDIARLRAMYPEWDGTVLCGQPGGVQAMREELLDHPQGVERWVLDERVVDGRRPKGVQHPLHRLQHEDVGAVGGVKQAVQAILPGANKTLRQAAESLLGTYDSRAAYRLSVASALCGIVPDDVLAQSLASTTLLDAAGWAPVRVERFRENFLHATSRWPERRSAIAESMLSGAGMTEREKFALFKSAIEIPTHLIQHELNNAEGEYLGRLCLSRQFDAETLELLVDRLDRHERIQVLWQKELSEEMTDAILQHSRDTLGREGIWNPLTTLPLAAGNAYAERQLLIEALENFDRARVPAFINPYLELSAETHTWLLEIVLPATASAPVDLKLGGPEHAMLVQLAKNTRLERDVSLQLLERVEHCQPHVRDQIHQELAQASTNREELQLALLRTGNDAAIATLVKRDYLEPAARCELIKVVAQGPETHGELRNTVVMRTDLRAGEYETIRETWTEVGQLEALEAALRPYKDRRWDDPDDYENVSRAQRLAAIEQLAKSPHDGVRREIAKSEMTPRSVMESLANDESPWVAQTAQDALLTRSGREWPVYPREEERPGTYVDSHEWDVPNTGNETERDIDVAYAELAKGSRSTRHSVERDLQAAAVVATRLSMEGGDGAELRTPSSLADLPGFGSLPFRDIKKAQAALDGERFSVFGSELEPRADERDTQDRSGGMLHLTARVLSSAAAIDQNAEYMGNCTSGYIEDVSGGDVRLVGLYDEEGRCHLNVELTRTYDGWRAGEINTRFNGYGFGYDATPRNVQMIADSLAKKLSVAEPKRPLAVRQTPPDDEPPF